MPVPTAPRVRGVLCPPPRPPLLTVGGGALREGEGQAVTSPEGSSVTGLTALLLIPEKPS